KLNMITSPTAYRHSVFRDLLIHRRTGMGIHLPIKPGYEPNRPRRGCTTVFKSALFISCFIIFILFLLTVAALLFIITLYPDLWESFLIKAREVTK
ncbi:hypothetical protein L0F63_001688, partial [Massospora cicadina]